MQVQVHCLTGHEDTVASILTQSTDPQVSPLVNPQRIAKERMLNLTGVRESLIACCLPDALGTAFCRLQAKAAGAWTAGHHRVA